jgi:SAM-dependent methyltransferase
MRFPIKLARNGAPRWLWGLLPTAPNPRALLDAESWYRGAAGDRERFALLVSATTSSARRKTTHPRRHPETDARIARLCAGRRPVVLDVGVSDGVTALELIERLGDGFAQYVATDASFRLRTATKGATLYGLSPEGECLFAATPSLVIYPSIEGAWFPLGALARRVLAGVPANGRDGTICLAQPELRRLAERDTRVELREASVFEPWSGPTPDLVKVANVLNRDAFDEDRIQVALCHLRDALRPGGHLFLTENREREQVSVLCRTAAGFVLEERVEGGSDLTELALDLPE